MREETPECIGTMSMGNGENGMKPM